MKVLLVTGGAGFIGSHFIKYFIRRNKNFVVVNIDNLSPTASLDNLKDLEDCPRYHFVKGNLCNAELLNYVLKRFRPDYIINFASETRKARGLQYPLSFSETNVMGTLTLLEGARYIWGKRNFDGNLFIQISTDEVYGTISNDVDYFLEESKLAPDHPYSASKAAADLIVKSFVTTYGFPAVITRSCSNYGPCQHKESFIPRCIHEIAQDRSLSMEPASYTTREWIHVLDHCIAIIRTLFYGKPGEIYNIGTGEEASEVEVAKSIARLLNKPEDIIQVPDNAMTRIKRCALNSYKARNNLNWSGKYTLEDGLKETVEWYQSNPECWNH